MANLVIILGASGTGKSTSIKGLNPSETFIFNTLNKPLPFKGSKGSYNKENQNIATLSSYDGISKNLKRISDEKPNVKNVVIDDSIYVMRKEFFARSKEKGYDKFTDLATHFQEIIQTCEICRPDLNVFLMLHPEPVVSDGTIIGYKVATVGKLLDQQYNPIEIVSMVLFSAVVYDEDKPSYGFYTHRIKDANGIEIPAKTPDGMFDKDFIQNDLGEVVKAMNEYYN